MAYGPETAQGYTSLTSIRAIKVSAASPSMDRQAPKKRETVMTPRIFMLTAAVATLSGNMLRTTSSREFRADAGGAEAASGVAAACSRCQAIK